MTGVDDGIDSFRRRFFADALHGLFLFTAKTAAFTVNILPENSEKEDKCLHDFLHQIE